MWCVNYMFVGEMIRGNPVIEKLKKEEEKT